MSELFSEDGTTHKWRKITAREVSKYGVFSGPYLPVFGLNTETFSVNLRIQ